MDSDNVYQPSSYFQPTEPASQVRARDEEVAETLAAIPLLKEIVGRLDERIAFYGSVSSVPTEALTNPEVFMHIIAANKLTIENLDIERSYILERVERIKK